MFEYINGTLASNLKTTAVIVVGGIVYKITTSTSALSSVGEVGCSALMYTYMYVREDNVEIFGFPTKEERSMFLQLLSVSGVGPKAAIGVLSVTSPSKLALAVITDDVKTIMKAPGIGKKTAQRIILELKDKLKNESLVPDTISAADTHDYPSETDADEAVSALMVLGYSQAEALEAVAKTDRTMSVENIVKAALKNLMK